MKRQMINWLDVLELVDSFNFKCRSLPLCFRGFPWCKHKDCFMPPEKVLTWNMQSIYFKKCPFLPCFLRRRKWVCLKAMKTWQGYHLRENQAVASLSLPQEGFRSAQGYFHLNIPFWKVILSWDAPREKKNSCFQNLTSSFLESCYFTDKLMPAILSVTISLMKAQLNWLLAKKKIATLRAFWRQNTAKR